MTDSIETRVARGVALLDATLPEWPGRVDLARLDLLSACNCILGQTWGRPTENPFFAHSDLLFGTEEHQFAIEVEHGFNVDDEQPTDEYVAEAQALADEWYRTILARRIDRMTMGGTS